MDSVVNRPTTNRRLIDGRPADRPTSPTKINRQTDQKRPSLFIRRRLGRLCVKAPISEKYHRDSVVNTYKKYHLHIKFIKYFFLVTHPSNNRGLCHLNVVNLRFYLKANLLKRSRLLRIHLHPVFVNGKDFFQPSLRINNQ